MGLAPLTGVTWGFHSAETLRAVGADSIEITPEELLSEIDRDLLGEDLSTGDHEGSEDDETDGHVDNLACFVRPGAVLALTSDDPEDGNHAVLQDNLARLRAAKDAKGRELEVIEVAQPARREGEDGRRLSTSYVNFYIANGGVIMPSFEDGKDAAARDIVTACFPEHQVRQVLALDIVRGGGGIHCITQQQPMAIAPAEEAEVSEKA